MKLSAILQPLVDAGVDAPTILKAVKAWEAQQSDALERRRAADRDKVRRRRKREDVSQREWTALRTFVFERDGLRCAYCGDEEGRFQIDHVIPVSRGGSSSLDNLVVACRACNASKRDLLLREWGGK